MFVDGVAGKMLRGRLWQRVLRNRNRAVRVGLSLVVDDTRHDPTPQWSFRR